MIMRVNVSGTGSHGLSWIKRPVLVVVKLVITIHLNCRNLDPLVSKFLLDLVQTRGEVIKLHMGSESCGFLLETVS